MVKMCTCTAFFPGVPVHNGITIVLSLFRSHWLVIVYCLVYCIGSPCTEQPANLPKRNIKKSWH